jgi:Tfp pilus assembly protein PilV
MLSTARTRISAERGSLLIEVMVAAVLVAVMGAALFGALDSSAKVSGTAKARAGAAAIAQDDQERMRAMPVVALNNMRQHRDPVTVGKISYVVDSRADWIADASGSTDCTANGKAADYLKITSTVDAKNVPGLKPVVVTSLVTPAPGTFQGSEGSAAVTVVDRDGIGIPGLSVSINGPTFATDVTDSKGCAFFGYEPSGNYTGLVLASEYVDVDGNVSGTLTPVSTAFAVLISPGTVSTVSPKKIDLAGKAQVRFKTTRIIPTPPGTETVDSFEGYVGFSNAGVTTNQGTRVFGNGTPSSSIDTTQTLFPFTSPYNVFAGDCVNNDPAKNGVTPTTLTVLRGKVDHVLDPVPVAALNLTTVWNGLATGNFTVTVTSTTSGCASKTQVFQKTNDGLAPGAAYKTGLLDDPGLPYGTYKVCVDNRNNNTGATGAMPFRHTSIQTKTLNSLSGTAAFTMDPKLTGTGTGTGACQNPLP